MKKTTVESIGSLINRFELEEEKQNVETFNRLFFNCKIHGFDSHLSVKIGEYNKGRRTVTIGDTITLDHEFSLIDLTLGLSRLNPFLLRYPNGELIGKFYTLNEAAAHLDIVYSTFRNYVAKSKYIVEGLINE